MLNPNLLVNLTGPGGSFFNNANNVSLNQVPDITVKAAYDPRLGPYRMHLEAWALYRQFFDRFNFANHTYDTGSFGGHINAEILPCNGNTKEVRQYTAGIYDTVYQGNFGTVKAGVKYSYNQRFAFQGVGGAPKTDDNIVMTQLRYYPFN